MILPKLPMPMVDGTKIEMGLSQVNEKDRAGLSLAAHKTEEVVAEK